MTTWLSYVQGREKNLEFQIIPGYNLCISRKYFQSLNFRSQFKTKQSAAEAKHCTTGFILFAGGLYMQNDDTLVEKLNKEIKMLEEDVETQAYISGLWIRYFKAMKVYVNKEHPGTALADIVNSAIMESSSWEDVGIWLQDAKQAEKHFFEKVQEDVSDEADIHRLRTEIDFLKGVVRALLSTRENKLESLLSGYKNWKLELRNEIKELLDVSGLVCGEQER